jgi:hypothetical protein
MALLQKGRRLLLNVARRRKVSAALTKVLATLPKITAGVPKSVAGLP